MGRRTPYGASVVTIKPMKYEVLYYPNFEPGQRWLRSILLFVDEVWRIIPPDANHEDSPETQELVSWMPEAFQTIAPNADDVDVINFNLKRLDLAFAKIRQSIPKRPRQYQLTVDTHGSVFPMQGDVWLAKSKANDDVFDLLYSHGLARPDIEHPNGNLAPVQLDAANLIVSYIADKIAARTGFDTISDCEMPYAIRSFDSLGLTSSGYGHLADGLLVSAGAIFTVPTHVTRIPAAAFQELRQSFKDVRPAFHNLMQSFAMMAKLHNQRSTGAFERKFEAAITEYQREFEKYKNTAFARKIDDWTPFVIQSLLTIGTLIWPGLAPIFAVDAIAVEVMKRHIKANREPIAHEKTFRMLCKLEKKINKLSNVSDLI